MAAFESGDIEAEGAVSRGGGDEFVVEFDYGVDATGTADAVFAEVLVVEVEEDLAFEPGAAEACGACETGFFVDCE